MLADGPALGSPGMESQVLTDLTTEEQASVRRAANGGQYNLLLGAGASFGSTAPNGSLVPMSTALSEAMASKFNVPREADDLLWRIYQRSVEATSESAVYNWLREIFYDLQPTEWLKDFARYPWDAVWTLNVDDAFERAYKETSTAHSRDLDVRTWTDPYSHGKKLNLIHLHGSIRTRAPSKLIFSLPEYADAITVRSTWASVFHDTYQTSPFVVIGARLRDEPDLERVFSRRKIDADAPPSFYVNPNMSDVAQHDIRRWGLIPVNMTGEEFIASWAALIGYSLDEPPNDDDRALMRFGRQFLELRTDRYSKTPTGHDFLGGDEPLWSDIVNRVPAQLESFKDAQASVRRITSASVKRGAVVLVGDRLSGLSTLLLQVARATRAQDWIPYIFTADERIDVEAVIWYASRRPLALIFDRAADLAVDINELLNASRELRIDLLCIGADSSYSAANVVDRIDASYIQPNGLTYISRVLGKADGALLVDHLAQRGRLGFLESSTRDPKIRAATAAGREIFEFMASLEDAPGFGRRVGLLVNELKTEDLELIFLSAVVNRVGRRLDLADAARMLGSSPTDLSRSLSSKSLASLVSLVGQELRPRHRFLALDNCMARLGQQKSLEVLADGIIRLQPRLNLNAMKSRNATAVMVGELMRYRHLSRIFQGADLDRWYANLLGVFGNWSARYWEQRAINGRNLASSRPDLLASSESYARRAVTLLPDDEYTLTTLGTVLLTKAALASDLNVLKRYYESGEDSFIRAADRGNDSTITYIARLRYLVPVIARARELGDGTEADEIDRDWERLAELVGPIARRTVRTAKDYEAILNIKRQHPTSG